MQEILNYLQAEDVAHSADSKITRFYFTNGQIAEMHFFLKDQKGRLFSENKWLASTIDNPTILNEFDGDDIEALKSGTII